MRCIPAPGTAHGMGTEKTTTHPSLSLRPLYCTLPMPNCHVPPAARRTCRSKRRLLPARGKRGASSPSPRLTRRSLVRPQLGCDGITTRQKPPGHTKALRRHGMESSIPCACSQRRYPSSPPLLPCCLLLHDSLLDPWASKLAPGHKLPQPIGSGRRGGGFGFGLRPTCLPPTSIHGSGHCNPGPPNLPDSHRSLDAKHCRRVPCHRLTALASQFHDQWAWIPSIYIMIIKRRTLLSSPACLLNEGRFVSRERYRLMSLRYYILVVYSSILLQQQAHIEVMTPLFHHH